MKIIIIIIIIIIILNAIIRRLIPAIFSGDYSNFCIAGNDAADTLAKKVSTIIQQYQSSISYHSAKISIKTHFKNKTLMELTCRT